uniref:Uncharacterized protein n=1 Tax=Rhizophora mucronata TaxID=61149 RepID=A0A2P2N1H6_RHIMU
MPNQNIKARHIKSKIMQSTFIQKEFQKPR